MVAYLSEFVVSPGKSEAVCEAFEQLAAGGSEYCLQTISASDADAPRRIVVLHVFDNEKDATRYKQDVLQVLVQSLGPHLDAVAPPRKLMLKIKTTAAAVPKTSSLGMAD